MMSKAIFGAAVIGVSVSGMSTTPMMDMCPMEGEMPMKNSDTMVKYVTGWYGTTGPYDPPMQTAAFLLTYAPGHCTSTTPIPGTNKYAKFMCDADGMGYTFMEYAKTDPTCSGSHDDMWYNASTAPYMFNCMGSDAYVAIDYGLDAACTTSQSTFLAVNVCTVGALPSAPMDYLFQQFNCDSSSAVTNFFEFDNMAMCHDDKFCTEIGIMSTCAELFKVGASQTPIYGKMVTCHSNLMDTTDMPQDDGALMHATSALVALVSATLAALLF